MALAAGTRIGIYEVVSLLGAGGMGEVYRARDPKLNRDVALKVLAASLAHDPDRLARFRREAQVLAALNHPNIAHIYEMTSGDVPGPADDARGGASDSRTALVMELVEGHTLAERIALGPVPLREALAIAKQIADALETAHEQGIVHRDLKPANVKVKDDGTVKVLDFGLAKALDPAASGDAGMSPAVMNSPTLTAHATQLGMILGTAAYMAPEQAKGRAVDRRADIWAFGVVLFEMLTGKRGFEAEDISETLAAVLTRDVDWTALPAATPARVKALVRDCLVRDPRQRLRDIGDARRALEKMLDGAEEPASVPAAVVAPSALGWRRVLPWGIAVAAVAGAIAFAALFSRSAPAAPGLVTRVVSPTKESTWFPALSRDGTKIVYSIAGEAGVTLGLRMFDEFEGHALPGTSDGVFPIFSPDGQWIAYTGLSDSKVRKIPVAGGGTPITLCDGDFRSGAAWGDDNTLVFSGAKGLLRVSAEGGTSQPLTTLDETKGETMHSRPQFLPGGRQLLFTVTTKDGPQFALLDLRTNAYHTIAKGGAKGMYVNSGHLTYLRDTTLFAVPFDLKTLSTTGGEVPVVERISIQGPPANAEYAVSDQGLLVYMSIGGEAEGTTLAWVDRKGKAEKLPGQSTRLWGTGRLSPDGRRVANAIERTSGGIRDIWMFDVERGTPTRLTFTGTNDFPIWMPDSKRVVFSADHDGKTGLYIVPADASAQATLVLETPAQVVPSGMSPDGRTLLFTQSDRGRGRIMMVSLTDGVAAGTPKPLHDTASPENGAVISPDGRWVAYASLEAGASDVYVQAFPGGGAKLRISTEGGTRPRWSLDSRELLYWTNPPAMSMVSVAVVPGPDFHPGPPESLFRGVYGTTWDTTPDRSRFLVELTSSQATGQLAVVTNWFEELRHRAQPRK